MTNPREDALAALRDAFRAAERRAGEYAEFSHQRDELVEVFDDLWKVVEAALQAQQPTPGSFTMPSREWLERMAKLEDECGGSISVGGLASDLGMLDQPQPTPDGERERLLESIHIIDADRSDGAEVGLRIGGVYLTGPFRERRKQAEKDAEKIRAALLREAQQPREAK